MIPAAHGSTIIRLRRTGADWGFPNELPIDGAFIAPSSAQATDWMLYAASGIDVVPGDRLVDQHGSLWEVVAPRFDWDHPFVEWTPGSTTQVAPDPLPRLADRCEIRMETTYTQAGGKTVAVSGDIAIRWRGGDSVPCLIQDSATMSSIKDGGVAGQDVTARVLAVTFPWDLDGVLTGRVLRITRSADLMLTDSDLLVVTDEPAAIPLARKVAAVVNLAPPL